MYRGLLPNILVSLGLAIILLGTSLPILEWQIGDIVADYPPTYEVHAQSSPWKTRLGDSLDRGIFVSVGKFFVSQNGRECSLKSVNFIVERSQKDEEIEHLILSIDKNIMLLIEWIPGGFILSVIYIWWFTLWNKRPVWKAIVLAFVFTIIAGIIYVEITQIFRLLLPRVVPLASAGTLDCYDGTLTFSAVLSKIHYETLAVLFIGIILEAGALVIILRNIIKAVFERKRASK